MKIFLHDYGAYAFTLQLAKAWAYQGHSVLYTYSDSTQYIKRAILEQKIQNLVCKGITLSQPFYKYSFFQRLKAEMEHGRLTAAEIRNFRPDIVISANTPLDAQVQIFRAGKAVSAKLIFWLQDVISIAIKRTLHQKFSFLGDLIGSYYQLIEKRLLHHSDKVILISEDFQGLMDEWKINRDKRYVIPNWMPLDEIIPQPKVNPWSIKHKLHDKFCYIYTGILGLKHDPSLFLDLAKQFIDKENLRIVVISEGELVDDLKSKAVEMNLSNLIILPFQDNLDYPLVLGTADVLISILNVEAGSYSVPSKVLTYLCAGRPILLSVPPENAAAVIVELSQSGLISAPGRNEVLLNNARSLFEDEQSRHIMGKNARIYAETHFEIKTILKMFEHVMR